MCNKIYFSSNYCHNAFIIIYYRLYDMAEHFYWYIVCIWIWNLLKLPSGVYYQSTSSISISASASAYIILYTLHMMMYTSFSTSICTLLLLSIITLLCINVSASSNLRNGYHAVFHTMGRIVRRFFYWRHYHYFQCDAPAKTLGSLFSNALCFTSNDRYDS